MREKNFRKDVVSRPCSCGFDSILEEIRIRDCRPTSHHGEKFWTLLSVEKYELLERAQVSEGLLAFGVREI
jgi:hypothetical protein